MVASYLRHRALGWVAAILGLVAIVLTLITVYEISKIGADNHVDSASGPWQNLGSGGWLACLGFAWSRPRGCSRRPPPGGGTGPLIRRSQ